MTTLTRKLGRSGMDVSGLGIGCWAIGGPFWSGAQPVGWGEVDDEESVRAIRRALELGVNLFDTSDVYGTGHSERILARGLAGHRDDAVIATKWGNTFDEERRQMTGANPSPEYLRQALDASLQRLSTDHVDLFSCTSIRRYRRRMSYSAHWRSWSPKARSAGTAGAPTTRSEQ